MKVGEIVSIRAIFDQSQNIFIVTSDQGLLVRFPDLLISGTSVAGSLFCLRRGVLSDKFKGVDTGNKIVIKRKW